MPFPITGAEIAKTEAKVGFRFPLGLKSRFLKGNGGEVDVAGDNWWLIPFLDGTDRKRIARTCNDITRETTKMREWHGFPADAFSGAPQMSVGCRQSRGARLGGFNAIGIAICVICSGCLS